MNTSKPFEPSFVDRWVSARWALVPFLLLGGLGTGLVVIIRIAVHDPGFAVEPDYYQHALKWDAERARQQHSRDLGWTLEWDFSNPGANPATAITHARPLALTLTDAHGQPLSRAQVAITAFHNARAADVQHLAAIEQSGGRYTANLDMQRTGIWQLKVSVNSGNEQFSQAAEIDLNAQQGHPRLTAAAPNPHPDVMPAAGPQ